MNGAYYFVTFTLLNGKEKLKPAERDLIESSLRHFNATRYDLIAYVIMDDHVHVLVQLRDGFELSSVIHGWKSFTANQLQRKFGRSGSIWLKESFDRIIRDEEEYFQKAEYIITNPQRRWPEMKDYKWVWHAGMESV